MTAPFDRTALNDWFAGQLTGTTPVNLGVAPPGAGWVDANGNPAEPNQPGAVFSAYITYTPGDGTPNLRNPLDDNASSFIQPYTLTCVGGMAEQAEQVAADLRTLVGTIERVKLTLGTPWGIQQVVTRRLGMLVRNDATNPPVWTVADQVEIWLDRARSAP